MEEPEPSESSLPARDRREWRDRPGAPIAASEIEALFRRYETPIGSFLAQMVSDRALADDLTQDTFVAALKARDQIDSIENPKAWLFQIARNCALQSFRTRRRAVNAIKRLSLDRSEQVADPAEAIAVRDHLVRTLNPDERSILILRYVHGFSSQELAEMVGPSPEAIRKQLSRSRQKVIESMKDVPNTTQEKE